MKFQMAMALTLASSVCGAQDHPDPAAYRQFFRQVVDLKSIADRGAMAQSLNGQMVTLKIPTLQDVIGLSDAEVAIVNATAADFGTKDTLFRMALIPLTFESRLELAGTGNISEELARKMKDIEDQRNQATLSHVESMKTALSAASFEKLDAYVRATGGAKKSLQPAVDPSPRANEIK